MLRQQHHLISEPVSTNILARDETLTVNSSVGCVASVTLLLLPITSAIPDSIKKTLQSNEQLKCFRLYVPLFVDLDLRAEAEELVALNGIRARAGCWTSPS
jgi:hypothetical protein